MNTKTKLKIKKKINRQLAGRACQFFLFGTPSCKKVFQFRMHQFAGINCKCVPEIDDWILLTPKQ